MDTSEINIIEKWIVQNVDATVVPADEGNDEALVYNLMHLLRGDGKEYHYEEEQDKEIKSWFDKWRRLENLPL